MGSVTVAPDDVQRQLAAKCVAIVGHEQPASALVLDRSDQSLDHGDAAIRADGTEPLTDPAAATPTNEVLVTKLLALICDQVRRCDVSVADDSSDEFRKPVDRLASLDDHPRSFLVQPVYPGAHGGRCDQEVPGGLRP
jgi:hypothetical protein